MDRIVNLLNTESLTNEECYSYLNKDGGGELPLLFSDHSKLQLALNLFLKQKSLKSEFRKLELLQVASGACSNLSDGVDLNVKLTASRLLLGVCTTSVSSAYGVLSSHVLNQIISIIFKVSVDIIHNRISDSKRKSNSDEQESDEDSSEEEKPRLNSSADSLMANLSKSLFLLLREIYESAHIFWQRSEDYLLDAFSEALVAVISAGATKQDHFSDCSKMAGAILACFSCQQESCLMVTYRNLLPIVTLASRDMKLPDVGKYKVQCHISAVKVLVAILKSSRGVVSMWGTSTRKNLSSAKKTPRSKRKDGSVGTTPMSTPGGVSITPCLTPSTTCSSTVKTPSSTNKEEVNIPVPYACAIGLIQRLLLTASERTIPRNTIVMSVMSLINALHNSKEDISPLNDLLACNPAEKKKISKSSGRPNAKETVSSRKRSSRVAKTARIDMAEFDSDEDNIEFPEPRALPEISRKSREVTPDIEDNRAAVSRLLSFLVKMSNSSKLHHRSLSLDIGAALLQEGWLISNYDLEADTNDADDILCMLVARCSDVAATVRSRAMGAMWDLLENLSTIKRYENMDFFSGVYDLLVGGHSAVNPKSNVLSTPFLDKLREMACDNKPLVRVKAIQTLVLALTIEWPKVSHNADDVGASPTLDNVSYVQLYLSDDDVAVISERCSDQSIAVRKQAIVSLSAILQCRPLDSMLQDAWLDAVLPLILDPETTVQSKVTQSVFDIILLAAVEDPTTTINQAAWSICSKIGEMGCSKLLQNAVTATKKNGLLKNNADRQNSITLHDVLQAVKNACCVMVAGTEGNDINNSDNTYLSQESSKQDIESLRKQDVEVVSSGAWILLEALTAQDVKDVNDVGAGSVSADFVVRCWLNRRQQNVSNFRGLECYVLDELEIRMLRVMAKVADSVKMSSKRTVCSMLRNVLSAAQCDAQGVSAAITVLYSFSVDNVAEKKQSCFSSDDGLNNIKEFSGQFLNVAHEILFRFIWGLEKPIQALYSARTANASTVDFTQHSSDEIMRLVSSALFLIGDVTMLGFSVEEDEDSYVAKGRKDSSSLPTCFVSENSGTFKIHIPDAVVTMVQILMGHKLPNSSNVNVDDNVSGDKENNVSALSMSNDESVVFGNAKDNMFKSHFIPHKIRAQAFVVMGKLCLRSRIRARDHVNVFLRELIPSSDTGSSELDSLNQSTSALSSSHFGNDRNLLSCAGSHAVRSNSLIVLGDLCVRFTNLVDRHVGSMSRCLQDPNVMVRRHAFVLLTQLLLQEYIKWRGMLLFRFLAVVVDRSEEIAELAKYVLRHTLQTKYSGFMVQNFSEAIIVFNNCSSHATYRATAAIGSDGGSCAVSMDGIDLSGSHRKGQRMQIYEFMMEDITEEEKIQITANLSQDILAYPLDFPIETTVVGGSSLSPFESALEDAFAVLRSPLLRVGSKRGVNSQAEDDDEVVDSETAIANEARYALHKAKTKVLKKLSVQHLVDHMLPVVSSLKHYLECKRSPVQKSLMEYLMYLVNSHKAEVALALSYDPGLKDEIEYDIKLYEREKNEGSKRNRIHAAEKAVLNLEKSTTRKSSARASTNSRMSPTEDAFAERMISTGNSSMSRRNSRGTPLLNSSSKSTSSGRKIRKTPLRHSDDLSGRLGLTPAASPRLATSVFVPTSRKWSVNIADLDDSPTQTTNSSRKKRTMSRAHPSLLGEANLGERSSNKGDSESPSRKKNKSRQSSLSGQNTVEHVVKKRGSSRNQKKSGSDSLLSLK